MRLPWKGILIAKTFGRFKFGTNFCPKLKTPDTLLSDTISSFLNKNIIIYSLFSTSGIDRSSIRNNFGRNLFNRDWMIFLQWIYYNLTKIDKIKEKQKKISKYFVQSICPKMSEIQTFFPNFNVKNLSIRHFW